jgi:hypothetical protein
MEEIWNSLQIAIIIVAAVSPIVIIILAIRFSRIKKRLLTQYQSNQKLVEKRIEVYDRMGPKLNDILSFFCYTGNWKELAPPDIMELKRDLDKDIQIHMPHFSGELSSMYNAFMQLCFVAHTGWEHSEKIKSLYEMRQENTPGWLDDWISYFDTNNVVEGVLVKERYDNLVAFFKKDLHLQ